MPNKPRPVSTYDNVMYAPDQVPSWQYYRCFSIVIKVFEVLFSLLTFIFAVLWARLDVVLDPLFSPVYFPDVSGAGVYVALLGFVTTVLSVCFLFTFICCAIQLTDRLSCWFKFEFVLGIIILIFYFIAGMLSIIFAVAYPHAWIITTCVFTFLTQIVYGMDNGIQFIYWRENKRRDVWKHSFIDE